MSTLLKTEKRDKVNGSLGGTLGGLGAQILLQWIAPYLGSSKNQNLNPGTH